MRTDLRVLYLCDFDLSRGSGKDRATRQKLKALGEKVERLDVISSRFRSPVARFILIFLLDLKAAFKLLTNRPDCLLSRGNTGILSQSVAKMLGVLTVREVHSNAIEEVSLIDCSKVRRIFLRALALLSNKVDLSADTRIFNHPDLFQWYKDHHLSGDRDFFAYNGFDPEAKSGISKEDARSYFGIGPEDKIIVFVGAASKWHGVDYLVDLQREFNRSGDAVRVVIGGGSMAGYDPEGLCLNISPLDQEGCAKLIRAADLCVLPVRSNRTSPGSPLKLYDYIANRRYVLAQANTNGYSDEVDRLGVGRPIDFTKPFIACRQIVDALKEDWPETYPESRATWSDRMDVWVSNILAFRDEERARF